MAIAALVPATGAELREGKRKLWITSSIILKNKTCCFWSRSVVTESWGSDRCWRKRQVPHANTPTQNRPFAPSHTSDTYSHTHTHNWTNVAQYIANMHTEMVFLVPAFNRVSSAFNTNLTRTQTVNTHNNIVNGVVCLSTESYGRALRPLHWAPPPADNLTGLSWPIRECAGLWWALLLVAFVSWSE